MVATITDVREQITNVILEEEKPFKLSQLFNNLEKIGINDKILILDVLDYLYETGLVDKTEGIEDTWVYESTFMQ